AWREIARELGFEFTEEHNERLKGVSRMRSLEILLEVGGITLDQQTKERLAERKNKDYLSYILQMTPDEILPRAKDFLLELRQHNVKIALGSASKNAMVILNRLQIAHLFDAVIDGTKVTKAKPDPEIFLKGAEELHIPPENCVVFEDAEAGIEAAIAAKMKCVGIGSRKILGKANLVIPGFVDFSFQKLNELK
ncbi:MAG TPA: beta-phosphoglucomutase, partial [Bacteroidales bacterium]